MCEKHNQEIIKLKTCLRCSKYKEVQDFKIIDNLILDWCIDCCDEHTSRVLLKRTNKAKKTKVDGYKYCSLCSTLKEHEFFSKLTKSKDGLHYYCKSCSYKQCKRYKKSKKNPKIINERIIDNSLKMCSECNNKKSIEQFKVNSATCKQCLFIIRQLRLNEIKIKNKTTNAHKPKEQICVCCKILKPINLFKKTNNYKTGYMYKCKDCVEATRKKKRDRSKETKKNNERMKTDLYFKTMRTIRANLHAAFKVKKLIKTKTSDKYGIDRHGIVKYLGPKPSNDYHMDHIIPINAFNFNIDEHVRLCFSAKNLRWILIEENAKKSDIILWNLISEHCELLDIAALLGIKEEFDGLKISDLKKDKLYG